MRWWRGWGTTIAPPVSVSIKLLFHYPKTATVCPRISSDNGGPGFVSFRRYLLDEISEGEKLKSNDRRASGLMAYPRIGRSDVPASNLNFNRRHVMEPDTDFQFYSPELDSVPDKDYEGEVSPITFETCVRILSRNPILRVIYLAPRWKMANSARHFAYRAFHLPALSFSRSFHSLDWRAGISASQKTKMTNRGICREFFHGKNCHSGKKKRENSVIESPSATIVYKDWTLVVEDFSLWESPIFTT